MKEKIREKRKEKESLSLTLSLFESRERVGNAHREIERFFFREIS